jgi:hypothetical protein
MSLACCKRREVESECLDGYCAQFNGLENIGLTNGTLSQIVPALATGHRLARRRC